MLMVITGSNTFIVEEVLMRESVNLAIQQAYSFLCIVILFKQNEFPNHTILLVMPDSPVHKYSCGYKNLKIN